MIRNDYAKIVRGTVQIIPEAALVAKLETGKPLIVKLGMDPTSPDLHLGHAVVLKKLKDFQDLGHTVIFLIGDFTARIGDPTGKSKTRPPLSSEQIAQNMKTYFNQVQKILDPAKLKIVYNSDFLGGLSSTDMLMLMAKVTVARITEREDFQKRIAAQEPIGMHELMYPLLQGYDSVALRADVELGGTDQTFNLLMGRTLQEQYNQAPQVVITMPLLEGLDGVHKMSKSLGNAIGITEPAEQAYGKLMSVSDTLMWRYCALLLEKNDTEIAALKEAVNAGKIHPMTLKKDMAHDIVAQFWSLAEADAAQKQFEALFQQKDYSQATAVALPADTPSPIWIVQLLKLLGAIKSSSEAKRLIDAGAVIVDGATIKNLQQEVAWHKGTIIKVGKHRIYSVE
jgi:tyrosyl-tRNA synthetase